jgi:hypothetical protein
MVEEIKERVLRMDNGLHWYEIMTSDIEHIGENKVMHPMNDYSNLFHDVSVLVSMMLICCVLWWNLDAQRLLKVDVTLTKLWS